MLPVEWKRSLQIHRPRGQVPKSLLMLAEHYLQERNFSPPLDAAYKVCCARIFHTRVEMMS